MSIRQELAWLWAEHTHWTFLENEFRLWWVSPMAIVFMVKVVFDAVRHETDTMSQTPFSGSRFGGRSPVDLTNPAMANLLQRGAQTLLRLLGPCLILDRAI